jgi:hypothetical protein
LQLPVTAAPITISDFSSDGCDRAATPLTYSAWIFRLWKITATVKYEIAGPSSATTNMGDVAAGR